MGFLFCAGALEKFSFNGLCAILVLYMTRHLHFSDTKAFEIFGTAMALSFILSLLGGWLADKILGSLRTLFLGGLLMSLGLFSFLIPQPIIFYFALALVVLGSACIRSNIPSLVGQYLADNDSKRDSVFTTLYVFFNIGTLLGAIGCGIFAEIYGWHYSFLLSGLAMLFFVLILYQKASSFEWQMERRSAVLKAEQNFSSQKKTKNTFWVIACLMLFQIIFFALYNQQNLSLILFAERNVGKSLLYWKEIPTTFFQTIDPAWNIFLGTFVAWGWTKFLKENHSWGMVAKLAVGLTMISCGFAALALMAQHALSPYLSPWTLIGVYALFVIGELSIIPIGLSAVSRLAPKKYASIVMGGWYLAIGCSLWLASAFSRWTDSAGQQNATAAFTLKIYADAFLQYSFLGFGLLIFLFMISPLLKQRYASH